MPDMVSLVLDGPRSIDMQSQTMPVLPDDSVRAEAIVTGVSAGTERMWYEGTNPAIKSGRRGYPYHPGYEFVGRVVEMGSEVVDIEAGELVFAMKPHGSHAILGPADYWAVLPDDVDPDDAVATALTATNLHALHRAGPFAGDAVAVIGMGTLGLLCCQVLRATGAGEVIAISRSVRKRELAIELGASLALDPADPELMEQVLDCTGDRGVDVAIEWAGVDSAVHTAMRVVRNQGRVVVGGFHVEPFSLSGEIFFAKEITVHSVRGSGSTAATSEFNRWSRRENFDDAATLVASGLVVGEPLVTHRVAAPDLAAAYDIVCSHDQEFIQVVLDWTDSAS